MIAGDHPEKEWTAAATVSISLFHWELEWQPAMEAANEEIKHPVTTKAQRLLTSSRSPGTKFSFNVIKLGSLSPRSTTIHTDHDYLMKTPHSPMLYQTSITVM